MVKSAYFGGQGPDKKSQSGPNFNMPRENPVKRMAFTSFFEGEWEVVKNAMIEHLKLYAKRWAFQLERGEQSGRLHFQGRVDWKEKYRTTNAPKGEFHFHFSIEHDAAASEFYAMKDETRVEGPWTDKEAKIYIPLKFRGELELRGWQQVLVNKVRGHYEDRDDRHMICVVEPQGNVGKSWVSKYLKFKMNAKIIPPTARDGQDVVRCAMNQVNPGFRGIFVVDAPRSMSDKHWYSLAQGLETIKGGMLYDDRYKYTEVVIEPPVVVLMANRLPPGDIFSRDRWVFIDTEMPDDDSMSV